MNFKRLGTFEIHIFMNYLASQTHAWTIKNYKSSDLPQRHLFKTMSGPSSWGVAAVPVLLIAQLEVSIPWGA